MSAIEKSLHKCFVCGFVGMGARDSEGDFICSRCQEHLPIENHTEKEYRI